MILAAELVGAFLAGGVSTTVAIYVVGKRIMRKKLGGLLDLTGLSGSEPTGIYFPKK